MASLSPKQRRLRLRRSDLAVATRRRRLTFLRYLNPRVCFILCSTTLDFVICVQGSVVMWLYSQDASADAEACYNGSLTPEQGCQMLRVSSGCHLTFVSLGV